MTHNQCLPLYFFYVNTGLTFYKNYDDTLGIPSMSQSQSNLDDTEKDSKINKMMLILVPIYVFTLLMKPSSMCLM